MKLIQHARPLIPALRATAFLPQIVLLSCAVSLFSFWFLWRTPLQATRAFPLGSIDHLTARGFHIAETTNAAQSIRWTDGDSQLVLPAQGRGAHTLRLSISAPRPRPTAVPVRISVNGRVILSVEQPAQLRRYALLVPSADVRLSENVIRIESETFRPDPSQDKRTLGVVVFDAAWGRISAEPWLLPLQVLVITIAVGLFFLLLGSAGIESWPRVLVLILFTAILISMRHSDSRFVFRWHAIVMTLVLIVVFAVSAAALRGQALQPLSLQVGAWVRRHWKALAGYLMLTAVIFYRLVPNFSTHIIGGPGDTYEYLWSIQWFGDALRLHHVSPAFAPQTFHPTGYELSLAEMSPANTLLGLPLTWLFGPVVCYNIVALASFTLTGFFTYLLADRIGARQGAAWVAGVIFAFCVHRFYQYNAGHLNLLGTQWIALTLYGWEGVLTRRRIWDGYVSGVGMALAMWATWYYGTTLAALLVGYTLVRVGLRQFPHLLRSWPAILLAGAIVFGLVLPIAQPYLEARQRGEMFRHDYFQLLLHSALPWEFVLPSPLHPIWGSQVLPLYRWDHGERFTSLSYTMIALALAGVAVGLRRRVVWALIAVLLLSLVLSLGPELQLPRGPSIMLPVHFIYEYVPVFNNMRAWARMVIYVIFFAALLAALALTRMPRRFYRASWIAAALLVLLESIVILNVHRPGPRAVDRWLRGQPGSGAVIDLPNSFSGASEYYSFFSGKLNNGGHGTFESPLYREEMNALFDFPSSAALRLLQRWQTDYIIVEEAAMSQRAPGWQDILAAEPLLTQVYRADGYTIYHLHR